MLTTRCCVVTEKYIDFLFNRYYRMKENKNFLYDMTDVIDAGGDVIVEETTEPTEAPTEPVEEEEENGNAVVVWTGVMTLCAAAIVVILLNRKKLFGKFL